MSKDTHIPLLQSCFKISVGRQYEFPKQNKIHNIQSEEIVNITQGLFSDICNSIHKGLYIQIILFCSFDVCNDRD